ncbi:hypothetical protein QOZ80_9AG0672340 [Eleusine coracana subsp. coracana]|nr:hypothetical protein QOZ80_9AG0672340 [Eleusine coracana subsp. coracana]
MKHTAKATPQGSPARSSLKSGSTKRPREAAALSDVTNLLLPETPTPIKPRRTSRRPLPQPSEASSTCSSSASVTPAPKRSSAAVLEKECSVFKSPAISTVYGRRGTTEIEGRGRRRGAPTTIKGKGKEPAATPAGTASCPQLGKSTRDNNRTTAMAENTRPISSSAPCHEAKKKRPSSSIPKLPEDFLKKEREYFAAVDAFELPVEEVSETDLD